MSADREDPECSSSKGSKGSFLHKWIEFSVNGTLKVFLSIKENSRNVLAAVSTNTDFQMLHLRSLSSEFYWTTSELNFMQMTEACLDENRLHSITWRLLSLFLTLWF